MSEAEKMIGSYVFWREKSIRQRIIEKYNTALEHYKGV